MGVKDAADDSRLADERLSTKEGCFTAGASEFFILSQSGERPERKK